MFYDLRWPNCFAHAHFTWDYSNKQIRRVFETHLDDIMLKIEPDSGAEVNLIDEHQYKAFQHRTKTEPELLPMLRMSLKATLRNKLKKWRPSSSSLKAE